MLSPLNKFLASFVLLQLTVSPLFSFRSQFIQTDNHYEEMLLSNPSLITDIEATFIASGIEPDLFALYSSEVMRWKREIERSIPRGANQRQKAITIGNYLHTNVFIQYRLSATTLKEVFEDGYFNCLSATVLMNLFLKMFGIDAKSIILPTHVYTLATLDGQMSEIENTIKDGLSISENKQAQDQFHKLTGFDYSKDSKKKVVISWNETIGLLYSNRSYFDAKKNQHNKAFQNMLKAQVFLAKSPSEQTNLSIGYLNYSYNVYRNTNQPLEVYLKTLSILEEGLRQYPMFNNLKGNYLKGVGIVIDKMIEAESPRDKINELLQSTKRYLDAQSFAKLERLRYINDTIFSMRQSKNYANAEINLKHLIEKYPNDKGIKDLMQEYAYIRLKNDHEKSTNPSQKNTILVTEIQQLAKELANEPLAFYYSELARALFEQNDFQGSINMMIEAQKSFGMLPLVQQNGFVYAVNSAQHYLQQDDLSNALKYYKQSFQFKKDRQVIYNMGILYEKLALEYVANNNDQKTKEILKEAIDLVPNNQRLKQLAQQYNI
ncbi:MAG: tetratricopeptide repeat protein [Brevinema sp.]